MRCRMLSALLLAGGLLLGGCQNPDGSTDWGSTLALGAGAGLAVGLLAGAAGDDNGHGRRGGRQYRQDSGYGGGGYNRGYGGGYGRNYGGGYSRGRGRGGW